MKILLTAPPATGKSTVIDAVVRQFKGSTRGIVAREVLDQNGKRQGFTSFNAACESRQFMFRAAPGHATVGDFSVDVTAIDDFVVPELRSALREHGLVYVDEIGRAQARSQAFIDMLRELFASEINLLASIVYDDEPWSMEFKLDQTTTMLEVTVANRDTLPSILLAAFDNAHLFAQLSKEQQSTTCKLLQTLVANEHYVGARKLFDNALHYVTQKKVSPRSEAVDAKTYEISGKTKHHVLTAHSDGTFQCDCDLSNARGEFKQAEPCSHQLSVLIGSTKI